MADPAGGGGRRCAGGGCVGLTRLQLGVEGVLGQMQAWPLSSDPAGGGLRETGVGRLGGGGGYLGCR